MAKKERIIDEISLKEVEQQKRKLLEVIGFNIKKLRLQNKLTQNDLAFYCYLDISIISRLERGVSTNITLVTLQKLAILFETTIISLIVSNS